MTVQQYKKGLVESCQLKLNNNAPQHLRILQDLFYLSIFLGKQ